MMQRSECKTKDYIRVKFPRLNSSLGVSSISGFLLLLLLLRDDEPTSSAAPTLRPLTHIHINVSRL